MAKRDETLAEESAGAATLHPGSKTDMLKSALSTMAGMSHEDLSHFLNDSLKKFETKVQTGDAESNRATIAMKSSVKEDLNAAFGDDLSEEFKEKATNIFEAAVAAEVALVESELEEAYAARLEEEVEAITAELTEGVNTYVTHIAEEWMEKNEAAVQSSLRADIMESFIDGLKTLFAEHYIDIPDEKIEVVDELASEIEELKAQLNAAINENIEYKSLIKNFERDVVVSEVAEGLTKTQAEKLFSLAEGVDFTDEDSFRTKLEDVKSVLVEGKKLTHSTGILLEEAPAKTVEEHNAEVKSVRNPNIARYVDAISRTVK